MIPRTKYLLCAMLLAAPAAAAEIPRAEHPRPDFRRDQWISLNGPWEFRYDDGDSGLREEWWKPGASYDRRITVPFGWESPLSGVSDDKNTAIRRPNIYDHYNGTSQFGNDVDHKIGWYRRQVTVPATYQGKRVFLRFEAVDWAAMVWVNGRPVGRHEGGYTPFEFDVTNVVEAGKVATVAVRALDGTNAELPTGKQAYWYRPTSGIWQTVWLEARPDAHIERFTVVPRLEGGAWSLDLDVGLKGKVVKFRASSPDAGVERLDQAVTGGSLRARLGVKKAKPWTPDTPHLYDLVLELESPDGSIDTVHTYFGLRTVGRGKYKESNYEHILLNGQPVYLRGALDQSFNPGGIYTAPSDEFLRRDMELARHFGFNFLRIHIKIEEPRRLYWADRLGVLIMEDMPNTYRDTPHGRLAWEAEMRGAIERDRNHPSIISWCLFNETWGLIPLKNRTEVQNWVASMWKLAKQLDPTRLVEDHSPNKEDHVQTDINSFHFYSDIPAFARNYIRWIARQTFPGSPFNYVPGRVQDGAPLMNSEYGAIQATSGDRDVSWGFRSLTTQMRREGKIQGYVYTELTDIEWEHNGLANYDRSLKQSGYDAFVPGMDSRDLQGADFIGYEGLPAVEVVSGEEIKLPVFVSHYSDLEAAPTLRWWISGTDDLGHTVESSPLSRRAEWMSYRVTVQEPLRAVVPTKRPFVGALAMELLDAAGRRVAANFVNIISRPSYRDAPRVEVLGPRRVALRFQPEDLLKLEWPGAGRAALAPSKFTAHGSGSVEYSLAIPQFIRDAGPAHLEFLAEMATKAREDKLDWPSRKVPGDYPQTDGKKHPGAVNVSIGPDAVLAINLPDDPADSRGVLSHQSGVQPGSYGYLMRRSVDLASKPALAARLREGKSIVIRFEVPAGSSGSGLVIYGERQGRYPADPTLIVETMSELKRPVGWTSDETLAAPDMGGM